MDRPDDYISANAVSLKMSRIGFPFSFRKCTTANVRILYFDTDRLRNSKSSF